jgi:ferric-dicitrate binding protein FerR (iron transport regulator)
MADNPKQLPPRARPDRRNWGVVIAVAALIAIVAWTALAWNRATALGESRFSALIEKEKDDVKQDADAIRINIGRNIAYLGWNPCDARR